MDVNKPTGIVPAEAIGIPGNGENSGDDGATAVPEGDHDAKHHQVDTQQHPILSFSVVQAPVCQWPGIVAERSGQAVIQASMLAK